MRDARSRAIGPTEKVQGHGYSPIVTDDDYEAALAEIKRLWSAEAGSRKTQKIEVLAMLA
jgi:hypothetical protein